MASLAPYIFNQYFNDDGTPNNAGTITAYAAGTTTLKDTFTAADGLTANANPFTLGTDGRVKFYLETGSYDFVIKNSDGDVLDSITSVSGSTGSGSNSVMAVETIAELTALPDGAASYVDVGGYLADGDGGGGRFYWDSTSTTADDNGIVKAPDSAPGTGRWIRLYDDTFNVKWFGAVGDGSTDDTTEFNNAMTSAANFGVQTIDLGSDDTYLITVASFTGTNTNKLTFRSTGSIVKWTTGNADFRGGFIAGPYQVFDTGGAANYPRIEYVQEIYAEWFGAVIGSGLDNDSTVACQTAINTAQSADDGGSGSYVCWRLLTGRYKTSDPLVVTAKINIKGTDRGQSIIQVLDSETVANVISLPTAKGDTNDTQFSTFESFSIFGNSGGGATTNYGIKGLTNHSIFKDIIVTGTQTAALDIGYGWSNVFDRVELHSNTGNGLNLFTDGDINNVSISDCKFYSNTEIGLHIKAALGIVISGCAFENNEDCGLFIDQNVRGFIVEGCYFEGSSGDGHDFTSPTSVNIKSDIIINGGGTTSISSSNTSTGTITGCNTDGDGDYHVWAASQSSLTISGCKLLSGTKTLYACYGSDGASSTTALSNMNNLTIGPNENFSQTFDCDPLPYGSLGLLGAHSTRIWKSQNSNLAERDVGRWTVQAADNGGDLTYDSTTLFPGDTRAKVYKLNLANVGGSDRFGFTFDLDDNTQLASKFCVFSIWMSHDDTASLTGGTGANGKFVTMDAGAGIGWQQLNNFFKMPASGAISLDFYKASGAQGAIFICNPVLTEWGSDLYGMIGDRLPNSVKYASNGAAYVTADGSFVSAPDGTLHVHTATAGSVTADTEADDIVIENSGDAGLSILTPDADQGNVFLGSVSDNKGMRMSYRQSTTTATIGTDIASGLILFNGGSAVESFRITGDSYLQLAKAFGGTPDEITATSETVAASLATLTTEITTNGDSDLDDVSLANGFSGQVKKFIVVAVGNAADSVKITPASMVGGTQITFAANPLGLGCEMIYADNEGWVVSGNNGGTIS